MGRAKSWTSWGGACGDVERFGYRRKALGAATHKEKLGCSPYEIPPGTRPDPTTTTSPMRRLAMSSTDLARSAMANGSPQRRGQTT